MAPVPLRVRACGPASVWSCVLAGAYLMAAGPAAAQPGSEVPFGGVRVPACPAATNPDYGLAASDPIEIGGGPAFMAARKARYFAALRGPEGQPLRVDGSVGSSFTELNGEQVIIDRHTASYDGADGVVTVAIFMNAYRFSLPRVPDGFTCGTPLPAAVGPPPPDPFAANREMVALAVAHGERGPVMLPPLDTTAERGVLADQFLMLALRARAARAAGTPAPTAPGPETQGVVLAALPQSCEGRSIAPLAIDLTGPQGPVPRNGDLLQGATLAAVLPGVPLPDDAIGGRFAPVQGAQMRITYEEACGGTPAAVTVPLRTEPARLLTSRPANRPEAMPAGIAPYDAVVYLQAIIDVDGRFVRALPIGGPAVLIPAALDTLGEWRAEPFRINGVATASPIVLQVTFQ
jgi:hypothetical protein